MALKAILTADEHKGLGDGLKSEYVEREGKFFLDVSPVEGYSLEDVGGLKATLGAERTQLSKLNKQIEKFKDLDPSVDWGSLKNELDELKSIDPKKEADKLANTKFEAARTQLLTKHQGEVTARDDRIKHLTSTVEKLLIDSVAKSAIAEAKGSIELLLPHVRSSTRVKEENGEFSVEVVDAQGNVKIGDSKGKPMSISDLIAEMRTSDTFGRAFEGENKSGSGKLPTSGGTGPQLKRSQMTAVQKREYQQKYGQAAFLKLPLQ